MPELSIYLIILDSIICINSWYCPDTHIPNYDCATCSPSGILFLNRHLPCSHLVILQSAPPLPLSELGFRLKLCRSPVAYFEIRPLSPNCTCRTRETYLWKSTNSLSASLSLSASVISGASRCLSESRNCPVTGLIGRPELPVSLLKASEAF